MRYIILVLSAVALIIPSTASAATKPSKPSYKQLLVSRDKWRAKAIESGTENKTLKGQVTTLTGSRDALSDQVGALNGQVTSLTQQRDTALTGLSGQITVFVRDVAPTAGGAGAIYDTILAPARAAWRCGGSTYLGSTFISVDFNRLGYCD